MKRIMLIAAALATMTVSTAANAKPLTLQPVQGENQSVRFDRGVPTVETDLPNSAVKVIPLRELDHGSYQFMIAVVNKNLNQSGNFGIENITITRQNGERVRVFSREELEKRAKSRAMWSQIGMAMLAGAAAAAQTNNTTIRSYTPYGTYTTVVHRPGLSGGQVATLGVGAAGIALTQVRLEKTLETLGNEILQTTTVDPDGSYGGRVIIGKMAKLKPGENIGIDVEFNGEHHLLAFQTVK